MKYKEIETPRLLLRKFDENDLTFIYNHFKNEFVSKYLYDNEPPKDENEAKWILDWCLDLESEVHIRWCIVNKDNGESIGTLGFHKYDKTNNSVEIGYDLAEGYIRKGVMSEALKAILDYGFNEFNFNRVHASVAVKNTASNKLLESLGFTLEGVIRDELYFRGKYYDHNIFSLLKREF